MQPRRRVLLDVDGVIADFITPALQVVERITGKHALPNVMDEWDLFRDYSKEEQELFYVEFKKEGWCAALPMYPGAQAGVEGLLEIADVYFVTSPMHGPHWAHERTQWLINAFGITANNVIHTNAKHVCVGDVFVDDKPSHVDAWEKHHANGIAFLWDRPYNRLANYRRTDSWTTVRLCVQR